MSNDFTGFYGILFFSLFLSLSLLESKFILELCKQIEKRQSASIKNVKDSRRQERGDEWGLGMMLRIDKVTAADADVVFDVATCTSLLAHSHQKETSKGVIAQLY